MTQRTLTITQSADWRGGLRAAGQSARAGRYAGEVLNFESPAQLFRQLSDRRWELVRLAQGRGAMSVRELARLAERDVKRVHEDVVILAGLGLFERTASGGVLCPFDAVHVDFLLEAATA
jgi:predicted transcriptional regulator